MTDDLSPLSVRFMEAVRDRDRPFLEYHLAEEFTLTTGRAAAPVRGRAEWLQITASRYEIDEFAFDGLETFDYGPVGLVRSRYRQTGSMDGERRDTAFLMTDVWVERDGRPQLVTRHISPLPDSTRANQTFLVDPPGRDYGVSLIGIATVWMRDPSWADSS